MAFGAAAAIGGLAVSLKSATTAAYSFAIDGDSQWNLRADGRRGRTGTESLSQSSAGHHAQGRFACPRIRRPRHPHSVLCGTSHGPNALKRGSGHEPIQRSLQPFAQQSTASYSLWPLRLGRAIHRRASCRCSRTQSRRLVEEQGYTIAEAIERAGQDWVAIIPQVAHQLAEEGDVTKQRQIAASSLVMSRWPW